MEYGQNCVGCGANVCCGTFIVDEETTLRGARLCGDEVDVGRAGLDQDDLLSGSTTLTEVRHCRLGRRHFEVVVTLTCSMREFKLVSIDSRATGH